MKLFLLVLIFFTLTACSLTGDKRNTSGGLSDQDRQEIEAGLPVETIPPPMETQVFYMKPIVKKLLKKASKTYDEKNYHATVRLLERAIDISPNNPYAWQRLAMVRLKQHKYFQAEQLAVKSNVLGEANDALRMTNWQIIAEAKRAQMNAPANP